MNYKTQQAAHDEFVPYHKAVKLLRERFKLERTPIPMELFGFIPPRPKGMHWATYWRLLAELYHLQEAYHAAFMSRACAMLGWPEQ